MAEQIRETRLNRGWTQADLANASGKVQETISQLENPDYGSYTIKTLQRIAEAFDVALIVRFAPFSELADWMADLSPKNLAVPDYDHDSDLHPTMGFDLTAHEAGDIREIRTASTSIGLHPDVINAAFTFSNIVYLSDYRGVPANGDATTWVVTG